MIAESTLDNTFRDNLFQVDGYKFQSRNIHLHDRDQLYLANLLGIVILTFILFERH